MIGIFSHLNGVQYSQVPDLIVADPVDEGEGSFFFIGFDAADEVQVGVCGHFSDELFDLFSDFDAEKLFVAFLFEYLQFFTEGVPNEADFGGAHSKEKVLPDEIFVFISEAVDHVLDISWGMFDDE